MANNGLPMLDQRPAPQPLIDARVAGLVAAINSNNRGFLLDFLHANMALSSSSRETVAEYVDWLASFSRVSGGSCCARLGQHRRMTSSRQPL